VDIIAFMVNKATTEGRSAEVIILPLKIKNHSSRTDSTEITNITMIDDAGINKVMEPNLDRAIEADKNTVSKTIKTQANIHLHITVEKKLIALVQ